MAKSTMGTKLPRKIDQKMQIVGEQIKNILSTGELQE